MSEPLTEKEIGILVTYRKTKSFETVSKELDVTVDEAKRLYDSAAKKEQELMIQAMKVTEESAFRYVPRLELRIDQPQVGTMKVGSQILELLSSGIYSTPENAFKEVISNSFDADAAKVSITTSKDMDRIIVEDDGEGMDFKDFDERFTVISRSERRDLGELTTVLKRPIIGKIGIGFIAVSEICDELYVKSAKRGSETWFEATIDFAKFRKREARKMEFYDVSHYVLTNHQKRDKNEHYTVIELRKLRSGFKNIMLERGERNRLSFETCKSFEEIMRLIDKSEVSNVYKQVPGYWRFIINLAMIAPVAYLDDGPLRLKSGQSKLIESIRGRVDSLKFSVQFNGLELKKPIRLPLVRDSDIKEVTIDYDVFGFDQEIPVQGSNPIRVVGYLYNQKRNIRIEDLLRGVVLRVKNTAIGRPDPDFMGYAYPEKMHLTWTFGEIYCDGLEPAMNVDRSSFKYTDPLYQAVATFLHDLMHDKIIPNARERYSTRKERELAIDLKRTTAKRLSVIHDALGDDYGLENVESTDDPPVMIKNKVVSVNVAHKIYRGVSRRDQPLLEDIMIAIRVALRGKQVTRDEFWERFLPVLDSLLTEED